MGRQTIAVSAPDDRSSSLPAELLAELSRAGLAGDPADPPALWLVVIAHVSELRPRLATLSDSAPVLVVAGHVGIEALVEVMRDEMRVIGMVGADEGPAAIVALARTLLSGPIAVSPSFTVTDAASSTAAIAELRTAAIAAGLSGARLDAIEQCADELLTNALYAAPIDAKGARLFAHYTPRQRLDLRTQHDVTVGHTRDGNRFILTVRDAFGSLDRARLLHRLHAAANDRDVVERKVGGAGLGLFLVASEANVVAVEVVPGASTTITCVFEPGRPGPASRFTLRVHSPAEKRAHARVVRTPAARRRLLARALRWSALPVVVVALLVLRHQFWVTHLAVVTTPPDAVVEIDGWVAARDRDGRAIAEDLTPLSKVRVRAYRRGFSTATETLALRPGTRAITLAPVPTLFVTSTPAGAVVEIAGSVYGTTPAAITSLPPGERVVVALTRPGYTRATAELVVPARSEITRHAQALTRDPALALVKLVSDPPGASVLRVGERPTPERTYTPTEVVIPRDAETRFVLEMRGRVPQVVAIAPGSADGTEVRAELGPGTDVHFDGSSGTTVTVTNAPHCQRLTVPADCTLAPGTHEVAVTARGTTTTRTIVVATEQLTIEL